ncbi:MAG TPA: S8 family peptidase [Gemmatimonadaceae bacterium]|nr:S8 family peptidase [Gemmatimonadaceae bacterium]
MRLRVLTHNSISFGLGALSAAAILAGCAHVSRPGLASTTPSLDESSSIYSLASSSARPAIVYSTSTISFALDRIDQRGLPLDHTYRHPATGKGVTVYVFDGGVSTTHPELAGRVRIGFSGFPDDPKICNAHGTAVAGAIAGSTLGVAPDAEIVDVKMVQCEKLRGTIRAIVDGARWVIEDHKQHPGPAIANWSFIADTASRIPALDSAVNELRAAGIPVIVSAGNLDIDACKVSPGNAQGTIVVGASAVTSEPLPNGGTQMIDRRSPGTAFGACIDLYAPGDSVLLPSLDRSFAPITQLWNGTSMSAGYVSGAAALYLETHPNATPDDVADELKSSATANVLRDTRATESRMLYVGTRDTRLVTRTASRR